MIIYGLLKLILFVFNTVASIFGTLIPSFPDSIANLLDTLNSMLSGGITFISYFFYWPVVVTLFSLFIGFREFKKIKSVIMAVIGHFIAN